MHNSLGTTSYRLYEVVHIEYTFAKSNALTSIINGFSRSTCANIGDDVNAHFRSINAFFVSIFQINEQLFFVSCISGRTIFENSW